MSNFRILLCVIVTRIKLGSDNSYIVQLPGSREGGPGGAYKEHSTGLRSERGPGVSPHTGRSHLHQGEEGAEGCWTGRGGTCQR